ncbi:MAG: hypothetical protein JWO46_2534 [Nocardioidaceae bacterium]|nr:hypothetical protein [Nocardioidaceae bacterium]
MVFVGAAINTHGDPQDFVDAFRTQAETTGATVTDADVGTGALGVCSQSAAAPAVTSCAWSTGDSVGQLVPTVDGWDGASLGAAMKDFRTALETSTAD